MKTPSMLKTLSLCAFVAMSLSASFAQADSTSCLLGSAAPHMSGGDAGNQAMLSSIELRLNQQMDRIEQGLRSGQISPMQAGKMMREQWEAVQFQRGFLAGSQSGGMDRVGGGRDSCDLTQGIQVKQIAAKLAPVVSNMAAEGMQTATTLMRALGREIDKRTQDAAPLDDRF
jgi:hypothetical protein